MQLNKTKKISQLLAIASSSLIGASVVSTDVKAQEWDIDNTVLFYSESNNRVQAIETVSKLSKELDEDNKVFVTLTLDALTGASPNGASPTNIVQTFTSPSGESAFLTPAGQTPLDDAFKDLRAAISGSWGKTINRQLSSTLGIAFSKETDYQSVGINGMINFYSNLKNTVWQLGTSVSHDVSKPLGGIPIPLLFIFPENQKRTQKQTTKRESKNTIDFNVGVTQILNKTTIAQLSFSYSDVDGYQTDPYKILSFIDSGSGSTLFYINEKRPQKRKKKGIFTTLKHHTKNNHIITPSLRYYTDDWGIDSFTADIKYRIILPNENFIEPNIRYYKQSSANFYHHSLSDIDGLEIASADYRLAQFNATTFGVKFGHKFTNKSVFEARFEYYMQNGDDHPQDAIGIQRELDLFAEVKAIIVQLNYNFTW